MHERDRGAADLAAGAVLIGERLLALVLVQQVAEVDDVQTELEVLERLAAHFVEQLRDREVKLVHPRIAAGVAGSERRSDRSATGRRHSDLPSFSSGHLAQRNGDPAIRHCATPFHLQVVLFPRVGAW